MAADGMGDKIVREVKLKLSALWVARMLSGLQGDSTRLHDPVALRGVSFLKEAQNADGSWGGAPGVEGSIEETALACDALTGFERRNAAALEKGLAWLCREIAQGRLSRPAPIGLYFAKLWYFEKLYPIVFTLSALRRALECRKGQ